MPGVKPKKPTSFPTWIGPPAEPPCSNPNVKDNCTGLEKEKPKPEGCDEKGGSEEKRDGGAT